MRVEAARTYRVHFVAAKPAENLDQVNFNGTISPKFAQSGIHFESIWQHVQLHYIPKIYIKGGGGKP